MPSDEVNNSRLAGALTSWLEAVQTLNDSPGDINSARRLLKDAEDARNMVRYELLLKEEVRPAELATKMCTFGSATVKFKHLLADIDPDAGGAAGHDFLCRGNRTRCTVCKRVVHEATFTKSGLITYLDDKHMRAAGHNPNDDAQWVGSIWGAFLLSFDFSPGSGRIGTGRRAEVDLLSPSSQCGPSDGHGICNCHRGGGGGPLETQGCLPDFSSIDDVPQFVVLELMDTIYIPQGGLNDPDVYFRVEVENGPCLLPVSLLSPTTNSPLPVTNVPYELLGLLLFNRVMGHYKAIVRRPPANGLTSRSQWLDVDAMPANGMGAVCGPPEGQFPQDGWFPSLILYGRMGGSPH